MMLDKISCRFEKLSNFTIGLAFLFFGFVFIVFGLTILPFFGILLSVPAFIAGILFLKAHRSLECAVDGQR